MAFCYHNQKKLVFLSPPRCAGVSIAGRVGEDDHWLNRNVPGWLTDGVETGFVPVHLIPYVTGKGLLEWDRIFVALRNPFEQQVSQWRFWRQRGFRNAARHSGYHPDDKLAVATTFEQWVEDDRSNGPNCICGSRWRNVGGVYRWWLDAGDGKIPPNVELIDASRLPYSLNKALEPYGRGRPFEPLPHDNVLEGDHRPWQEEYTPRAVEAVRHKFGWAFANLFYRTPSPLDHIPEPV